MCGVTVGGTCNAACSVAGVRCAMRLNDPKNARCLIFVAPIMRMARRACLQFRSLCVTLWELANNFLIFVLALLLALFYLRLVVPVYFFAFFLAILSALAALGPRLHKWRGDSTLLTLQLQQRRFILKCVAWIVTTAINLG